MKRLFLRIAITLSLLVLHTAANLGHAASTDKPNIVMIMTDDLGYWNVGAYSHGMMVPTPNIDRLAKEGLLFTDHYAEPTCTPARAAFITGQMPIRTGLTTVGMPGSLIGLSEKDPTLAEVLKERGYRSGQFGKNHVGDRNEHLPTVQASTSFLATSIISIPKKSRNNPTGRRRRASATACFPEVRSIVWPPPLTLRRRTLVSGNGGSNAAPIQAP